MQCDPLRVYLATRAPQNLSFMNEALNHIEQHPLFRHPFFEAFAADELSLDQLRVWAKQRHFSSSNFPRFLALLISKLGDENTRAAYVKQLYEEHGELVAERIHARRLRQLIQALGVSTEELAAEPMLPGTEHFVEAYWKLCHGDCITAMAAFALGTEPVVPMEMVLCLRGLSRLTFLGPSDVIYFTDHAEHDYRHTAELCDALMPYLTDDDALKRTWAGMVEIIDARKVLYDGIAREIGIDA